MASSTRIQHAGLLNERLLIMRFITAIGMAFLLLFGVAGAIHSDADGSAPAPPLVMTVDAHDPSVDSRAAAIDEGRTVVANDPHGDGAFFGAALCALGVLCSLVLGAVMLLRLRLRCLPLDRGPRARPLSSFPVPLVRVRETVLSLTQLGLSRT